MFFSSFLLGFEVLHRDLKPSNIFLMGRGAEESVAVGDFGVSRPLAHAMELVTTMVGTPCYLSPEAFPKGDFKPFGAQIEALRSFKELIDSLRCFKVALKRL